MSRSFDVQVIKLENIENERKLLIYLIYFMQLFLES